MASTAPDSVSSPPEDLLTAGTDRSDEATDVDPATLPSPVDAPLASFGARARAAVVDRALAAMAGFPFWIGLAWALTSGSPVLATDSATGEIITVHHRTGLTGGVITLMVTGAVMYAAFAIWNSGLRQGLTGQSIGKALAGIRLVSADTLGPVGPARAAMRHALHAVDLLPLLAGYLLAAKDPNVATFTDKMFGTVAVVHRLG